MANHKTRLRIGTRASRLARWQADSIAAAISQRDVEVEIITISTSGDRQQQGPIENIGAQGVFTKEIQKSLLDSRVDLAVHSLKDLPTDHVPGLCLAAVPERAPAEDVLVSLDGSTFENLKRGAIIGTGSLRRQAQLLHARPDLKMENIRGNVETRLTKVEQGHAEQGHFDAIILAEAGLRRLGLEDRITQVLPHALVLPAVGQGALALEARDDDEQTKQILAQLDHADSHNAVLAERAMLSAVRGGCLAPIGAWGRIENDDLLHLSAVVLSADGQQRIETSVSGKPMDAEAIGNHAAEDLLSQGAAQLIEAARNPN